MEKQCALNFKIMISLLMFANDEESVNQGELLKMKKDFLSIVDVIGTDEEFVIYHSGIGLFGILAQILQALGVHFDPKIPLKYEKLFLDQKSTYVKFFVSLESHLDPCIEDCVHKSLEFIDELGFHELSPIRISLNMQSIAFYFMKQDTTNVLKGIQKINEMVVFLKKYQDKYDFCRQRLFQCYSVLVPISLNMNDRDTYMRYAKEYLILGIEYSESKEALHSQFITYIPILLQSNQLDEALAISEMHIKYLKNNITSKLYCEALRLKILVLKSMKNYGNWTQTILEYLSVTEKVHTKKSPEYLDAKKENANALHMIGQVNQAYKECLETYEIAKEVYGNETNIDCSDILTLMAILKARLKQFDEAQNFMNKCKEVEEQLSSVYSERYKNIIKIEQQIIESIKSETKGGFYRKQVRKKKSFVSKIAPNTPIKI